MRRVHVILLLVLLVVSAASLALAHRRWEHDRRVTLILKTLPAVPDLDRWPAEFETELQRATRAVEAAPSEAALAQLAELYWANGFDKEGEQTLGALRMLEPGNPRWAYLLAMSRVRRGDDTGAAPLLDVVTKLSPTYEPAWRRRGELRARARDWEGAWADFTRAANAAPESAAARLALARVQAAAGTRGDPRPVLATLAGRFSEIRDIPRLLASVYAAAGEGEKAAQARRLEARADREMPTPDPWLDQLAPQIYDPARLGALGREWRTQHRLEEAETVLRRAVSRERLFPELWLDLAQVLLAADRPADARAVLESAVQACPRDSELQVALVSTLRVEHKATAATAAARAALEHWPTHARLQAQLGFALRDAGELAAAVLALKESLRWDPAQPETLYALAFCQFALRNPTEARAAADVALSCRPDYAEPLIMLGGMALESGDMPTAERLVSRLHELQPDEPGSRLLYAGLYLNKGRAADTAGDLDTAAELYRTGLGVAPEFSQLLRESGLLAVRRAKFSEAAEMFERYLRIERGDLAAYLWLGDALMEADREPEAREVYGRGLAAAKKAGDRARATELSLRLDQ